MSAPTTAVNSLPTSIPTSIPTVMDPWSRETYRFVEQIFRGRFALAPLMGLVFCLFYLWDPVPWKLAWIGITTAAMILLAVVELRRLRRRQIGQYTIQLNLVAMLIMQTSMIYITGGIESPLLVIYVPLGLITGLVLGGAPRWVVGVVVVPAFFALFFAAGALGHWLPRATPAFFGLGDGFADRTVYVWFRAGLIVLLVAVTSLIGWRMRTSYQRVLQEVAGARRESLEALESRNRELLSVARTVAHELKNPLASIQGLAQLLARGAAHGSKDQERFEVMLREIGRMGQVLDEFRGFARPLSGLTVARTDLGDLLHHVALLSEPEAAARGVEVRAPAAAGPQVECDPQKVKQALLNLVRNALEALPGGGAITIAAATRDGAAEITVRDTGPGLAPAVRERLFQPGVTTKPGGSGIGLVVARSIAAQHGGRLTLADAPGGGCVATLTLPLQSAAAAEDAL
ncbi:MAG: HAMP domain-containing histidine kinase [Deltaproteobacteria bacterium]|nr:HAMP domain-containing histidine kinase [Deltaproteobacteria bacterium]